MEWPSLVDLRPRIDRDYKHCYNSITNSDRQLATPGRGTSLELSKPARCACAAVQKLSPAPHLFISQRDASRRIPSGLWMSEAIAASACVVATFVSASSAPRPLCAVGTLPLPGSLNRYVHSQTAPASRRPGCLVLWLLFVYVHNCEIVVWLAGVVRLARRGGLLPAPVPCLCCEREWF